MRIILMWLLDAYVAGFRGVFCIFGSGFMIYPIYIYIHVGISCQYF